MSKNSERIIHGSHYITSPFGGRIHPITGKYEGHLGIDYGTNGQKIPCYALEDGYIHIAKYGNGVGNYVFCEFPKLGMVGDYQHLDSFSVKAGQYVKKGQEIGIIGTTGDSTGIHLHFGLFPTKDLNKGWYEKGWVDFESYKLIELAEPTTENKDIDQLKVNADSTMYVRTDPNLNGEKLGLAKAGYYNVLETKEADGYIWVKIAEAQWTAVLEPYSSYIYKYEPPVEPPKKPVEEETKPEEPITPEEPKEEEKGEEIDIEQKIESNALIMLIVAIIRFIKKLFKGGSWKS